MEVRRLVMMFKTEGCPKISCAITKPVNGKRIMKKIKGSKQEHRKDDGHPSPSQPTFIVAAQSRIVACYHTLPHIQFLAGWTAGSPEVVSKECCLGGVCSPGAESESEHTRATPRTKGQDARM